MLARLTGAAGMSVAVVLTVAALAWVALYGFTVLGAADPGWAHGGHGHPTPAAAPYLLAWTLMMIAMMFPATAPLAAVLSRVTEDLPTRQRATALSLFLATYTVLWAATGVVPWSLQQLLAARGVAPALIVGVALLVAGIYQLSPAKRACLKVCRAPLAFFMAHYRPGAAGMLQFSARHTLACIGCCWALMLSMMALGGMSLMVMAGATALTTLEKLLPTPHAHRLARVTGVAAGLAGLALLLPAV